MVRYKWVMPRITKVYTKTGDDGSTALGSGRRVPKDSLRIEVIGAVDEVNAHIGAALSVGVVGAIGPTLKKIQNELFHLGADLCVPEEDKSHKPVPTVSKRHVDELEQVMDKLSQNLPPLENFVLPGGSPSAATLHVARAVCRRAERSAVALARKEKIGEFVVQYLNRLSDALFVMARYENKRAGSPDLLWNSRA